MDQITARRNSAAYLGIPAFTHVAARSITVNPG